MATHEGPPRRGPRLGYGVAGAALELLLFVLDKTDVPIPAVTLWFVGACAAALLLWSAVGWLRRLTARPRPQLEVERLITSGRALSEDVLGNPSWTEQDALAEYLAWHARATAWVRRRARRYLDRWGSAQLDRLDTYALVAAALSDRIGELEWIAAHLEKDLPGS